MWENSDNEIFEGRPLDKWKEIIFNASRTLASGELDRLLEKLALYELAFEEHEINVDMRELHHRASHDEGFKQRLQEYKTSLAIESMSKILSENE